MSVYWRVQLFPRSIIKKIDNQPNKNKSYRPEMMFINSFVLVLVCWNRFEAFLIQKSLHQRFWPNQQIIVKFKCLRSMVSLFFPLGLVSSTQWRRQNTRPREGTRELNDGEHHKWIKIMRFASIPLNFIHASLHIYSHFLSVRNIFIIWWRWSNFDGAYKN